MKKFISTLLLFVVLVSAVGCSSKGSKQLTKSTDTIDSSEKISTKKIKEDSKTELNKTKTLNGLEINIEKVSVKKDDTLNEDQKLIEIQVTVNNKDKNDLGIGAGDFYIKDKKGKKYQMYGHEENFGDVIKSEKSLTGKGYYVIKKGENELTVVYDKAVDTSKDKKTLEWYVGVPK